MAIEDYFVSRFTITAVSNSIDLNGDPSGTLITTGSGYCKLEPLSGNKATYLINKNEVQAQYRAYLPITSLTEFKNIIIDNDFYDILFIANRTGHHLEVDLRKVTS